MSEELRKIDWNTSHSARPAPMVVRAPGDPEKFEFSFGLVGSADAMFAVIEGNGLPQMAQSPRPTDQARGSSASGAPTGK
jgi:hypothetical protein